MLSNTLELPVNKIDERSGREIIVSKNIFGEQGEKFNISLVARFNQYLIK